MKEEIATSASDIAGADSKIGGKPMKRNKKDGSGKGKGQPNGLRKNRKDPEDCRKKKIIKEFDGYSFYQQNDLNIFEITDNNAQVAYLTGYRTGKPQYWQQNEITSQMVDTMNKEGGRNFTVKIGDQHSFPLKK